MPGQIEELQCPLKTEYATSDIYKLFERPFAPIKAEILEKLFVIRQWPIADDSKPIPFRKPVSVREFHFDPFEQKLTDKQLVIKEFQKQAIFQLIYIPRFVLGDSVGLCKTTSCLIAFAWLKERNPNAKMLVITTKSTALQWVDECQTYTTLRAKVMSDTYKGLKTTNARYAQMIDFLEEDKYDILVAKYDSLKGKRKINPETQKREKESEETRTFKEIIKKHKDKLIITLDECHRLKKPGTEARRFVMAVCRYPERVWALTATAIKNSLDEFYSIALAVGIAPLGSMTDFWRDYCLWREAPIGNGRTISLITGFKNVAYFKEQMRPFFLGRSQKQVNEKLPALTTIYHPIDLDEKQTKILTEVPMGLYELPPIVFKVAGEWYSKERDTENEMTQLSVQQLVVNHWALLDRNNPDIYLTTKLSPKEEALLEMLDGEYRGEKVIIYSKFKSWIDRLEWLTKNGHFTKRKFLRITGDESEKRRRENKHLFQSPDSGYDSIFINAAGMEGINLQQAAHMILLDCPWSWGDLIQLVGRMIRMASPHSACTLHIMVAKGTIDEYAIETLKGKKVVFEAVLGNSHSAGILDSGQDFDIASGMEDIGTEADFHKLLRAYAKKIGMKSYLNAKQIEAAQNIEYEMVFERKGTKQKRFRKQEDNSWFLE